MIAVGVWDLISFGVGCAGKWCLVASLISQ